MRNLRILVERHEDGYVACPLGLKGVVVGEGDTHEAAVADAKSAAQFHVETFGLGVLEDEPAILDAFLVDAEIAA